MLIIRRSNFFHASSGMISLCKLLLGMLIRRELSSLLTSIPSSMLVRRELSSLLTSIPSSMPVRRELSSLLTGIPSSDLHRLIIPDDALIKFDLLMMSMRCSKHVER